MKYPALFILAVVCAVFASANETFVDGLSTEGSYGIGVIDEVLLPDEARGKTLPVKIRYPEGEGPFPVIVFSHGAGESKEAAAALSRHWCSHGFVCVHPTHCVNTPKCRVHSGVRVIREFYRRARVGADSWRDRTSDITLVLDALPTLSELAPELAGKVDATRVGVGGHSLGAYTAMLVGGADLYSPPCTEPTNFGDERADAVLLLSGPGRDANLTEQSWRGMSLPMMVMIGSRDPGLQLGQGPYWRAEPYTYAPPGDKYLVHLRGANHVSYVRPLFAVKGLKGRWDPLRPVRKRLAKIDPALDQRAILVYVRCASLAFWQATLERDERAMAYLRSDALTRQSHGVAKVFVK